MTQMQNQYLSITLDMVPVLTKLLLREAVNFSLIVKKSTLTKYDYEKICLDANLLGVDPIIQLSLTLRMMAKRDYPMLMLYDACVLSTLDVASHEIRNYDGVAPTSEDILYVEGVHHNLSTAISESLMVYASKWFSIGIVLGLPVDWLISQKDHPSSIKIWKVVTSVHQNNLFAKVKHALETLGLPEPPDMMMNYSNIAAAADAMVQMPWMQLDPYESSTDEGIDEDEGEGGESEEDFNNADADYWRV